MQQSGVAHRECTHTSGGPGLLRCKNAHDPHTLKQGLCHCGGVAPHVRKMSFNSTANKQSFGMKCEHHMSSACRCFRTRRRTVRAKWLFGNVATSVADDRQSCHNATRFTKCRTRVVTIAKSNDMKRRLQFGAFGNSQSTIAIRLTLQKTECEFVDTTEKRIVRTLCIDEFNFAYCRAFETLHRCVCVSYTPPGSTHAYALFSVRFTAETSVSHPALFVIALTAPDVGHVHY